MQETRVQLLSPEDSLEKEMATHSSILAWKTTQTEEFGRPMGSQETDTTQRLNPHRKDKGLFHWYIKWVAAAKSLQSCPTLCDPIDGSPPGSYAHGIFQARVLEWGAIAFSD